MEVGEKMLIVITYDVSTESADGKKRLRKIAKECVNYGQRVQNSVFECEISSYVIIVYIVTNFLKNYSISG